MDLALLCEALRAILQKFPSQVQVDCSIGKPYKRIVSDVHKYDFFRFFWALIREFGQSQYFCPGLPFSRSLVHIALCENPKYIAKNGEFWFLCKK